VQTSIGIPKSTYTANVLGMDAWKTMIEIWQKNRITLFLKTFIYWTRWSKTVKMKPLLKDPVSWRHC